MFMRSRKGFNLIEAAIVLGVVGLVIGGIWVAAATVSREHNIQRINKAILSMMQESRRIFTPAMFDSLGAAPANMTVTSTVIAAGIAPADMVFGTEIRHDVAGGNPLYIPRIIVRIGTTNTNQQYIQFALQSIGDQKFCTQLSNVILSSLKAGDADHTDLISWSGCSHSSCTDKIPPITSLVTCPNDGNSTAEMVIMLKAR